MECNKESNFDAHPLKYPLNLIQKTIGNTTPMLRNILGKKRTSTVIAPNITSSPKVNHGSSSLHRQVLDQLSNNCQQNSVKTSTSPNKYHGPITAKVSPAIHSTLPFPKTKSISPPTNMPLYHDPSPPHQQNIMHDATRPCPPLNEEMNINSTTNQPMIKDLVAVPLLESNQASVLSFDYVKPQPIDSSQLFATITRIPMKSENCHENDVLEAKLANNLINSDMCHPLNNDILHTKNVNNELIGTNCLDIERSTEDLTGQYPIAESRNLNSESCNQNTEPHVNTVDQCTQTHQLHCVFCRITFADEVMFSLHMGCHSHRDPFICNVCGQANNDRYAFYTHIMRGHTCI